MLILSSGCLNNAQASNIEKKVTKWSYQQNIVEA